MPQCSSCQKPKAKFACGLCTSPICKICVQFVDVNTFAFLAEVPEPLCHSAYCPTCFDQKISQEIETYNEVLDRARRVSIFYKSQSKETRMFRRKEEAIRVVDGTDKDETLLRLAFVAVNANFNTLVDVEISAEKVRTGGYQTSKWSGVGIPVKG